VRMNAWYPDDAVCTVEPCFALGSNDDRHPVVRGKDLHLLCDVIGRGAGHPGCAYENQRFRGQVDVLLVRRFVARDGSIGEFGTLDPDLLGRNPIAGGTDDRPCCPRWRVPTGQNGDLLLVVQETTHCIGERQEGRENFVFARIVVTVRSACQREREQGTRSYLRVEGLRGGDRHLYVAAVSRKEHTVGLFSQVATPTIDYRYHHATPTTNDVDCAIGVGRGSRLADCDRQGVRHVGGEAKAGELRRRCGHDLEVIPGEGVPDRSCYRPTGDGRGSLTDHDDPPDT